MNAGVGSLGPAQAGGVDLRMTSGFMLLVMVAGAPLGIVGWAATLLTFSSALLVQELPSVLWARSVGRTAHVVLSAGGGATRLSGGPIGSARTFTLGLCGSLGNLGVAVALWQLSRHGGNAHAAQLLRAAALVHMAWGVGQALPFTPFQVGKVIGRRLRPPLRFAHSLLSFLCITMLGLWALRAPGFPVHFALCVLGVVAAGSALGEAFNELQDEQSGVVLRTLAAKRHVDDDEPEQAIQLARQTLAVARVETNRAALYETLAWAAIALRDPFIVHSALGQLPAGQRDLHLVAAYFACCNRVEEAVDLLQEARRRGQRAPETSKLLVDLLFQSGQEREALAVAETDRELYGDPDWNAIEAVIGGGPRRTPA